MFYPKIQLVNADKYNYNVYIPVLHYIIHISFIYLLLSVICIFYQVNSYKKTKIVQYIKLIFRKLLNSISKMKFTNLNIINALLC